MYRHLRYLRLWIPFAQASNTVNINNDIHKFEFIQPEDLFKI